MSSTMPATLPHFLSGPPLPISPCQLACLHSPKHARTSPKQGDARYGPERARPVPRHGVPAHAVSAPRRRSGPARTPRRPFSPVLPSPSLLARMITTASAPSWTHPLARGSPYANAMIKTFCRARTVGTRTTPVLPRPPSAAPSRTLASPSRRLHDTPIALPLRVLNRRRHRRPRRTPTATQRIYK